MGLKKIIFFLLHLCVFLLYLCFIHIFHFPIFIFRKLVWWPPTLFHSFSLPWTSVTPCKITAKPMVVFFVCFDLFVHMRCGQTLQTKFSIRSFYMNAWIILLMSELRRHKYCLGDIFSSHHLCEYQFELQNGRCVNGLVLPGTSETAIHKLLGN